MGYKPETIAETSNLSTQDLVQYLSRELEKISQAFAPIEQGRLNLSYSEPPKKRVGMVVYADGTAWNPGNGAGLYTYNGTSWVYLSHAYTSTTVSAPVLKFGGASVGITYGNQLGQYTVCGKVGICVGRITLTNKGASVGAATIDVGLSNSGLLAPVNIGWEQGMAAQAVGGYWNGTTLSLMKIVGGATAALTDADFTNASDIIYSSVTAL